MGAHVDNTLEQGIKTLCTVVRSKLPEDDAKIACALVEEGAAIIPYRVKDGQVVPALSEYRQWLDHELNNEMLEWLAKQWRSAGKVDGWGILLGPPSQYVVMLDFDDETNQLVELFNKCNTSDENACAAHYDITWELMSRVGERIERAADSFNIPGIDSALSYILTRRGIHVLILLATREDWEELRKYNNKTIAVLPVTITTDDKKYQLKFKVEFKALGATPLRSYKHKPLAGWSRTSTRLTAQQVKRLLEKGLGANFATSTLTSYINKDSTRETPPPPASKLSEQNISKIVDLLKNYWVPGHRNNLQLGLVGWLIKRGIQVYQAEELIRRLAESAGDEEVQKRIDEVRRQYHLVQSGQKKLEELLGKAGLFAELQTVIKEQNPAISDEEARDRALSVVSELEKILGPRRSIILQSAYETNLWFVNDPARGVVLVKEKRDESGEVRRYRKYISDWYVRKVLIVKGDGQYMYKVLFKNARTKEKLVLAGQLDEIIKELKKLHGVKRSQHLGDAVSAIISEFIRRKMAKVKKTAAVAGILPHKDGVKLVRTGALSKLIVPKEPDVEKARQALQLLQKLREHYDPAKFDVAINWAGYAVASYTLKKHYHVKQLYLLLHGERQTGKSTLASIITYLYPVRTAGGEEPPVESGSEYRLAWLLNLSALPWYTDEFEGISHKPTLIALLKRAATSELVRWRGDTNRRYRARTPLIIVSNYPEALADPALRERLIAILFTHDDYVYSKPREEREEFHQILNEYKLVAPHLGALLLQTLVERWQYIAAQAHTILEKHDYIKLGQQVWRWLAEKLGVAPPEWSTGDVHIEEEEVGLSEEEVFWEVVREALRDILNRYRINIEDVSPNMHTRILYLAERGLLPPWMYARFDGVIVTAGVIREMERHGARPIGGLPGLAARLGFEYKVYKVRRRSVKGMLIPIAVLIREAGTLDDLTPDIEKEVKTLVRTRKLHPVPEMISDYIEKRWGLPHESAVKLAEAIVGKMLLETDETATA